MFEPWVTVREEGVADKEKSGATVTVRVTVALCWVPPALPVTVIGYVPAAVLDPTAIVIVELPPPGAAIVLGLKLTVVPLGAPAADRLMKLLKPPLTVVVIVEFPWLPCTTLTEAGEPVSVKLAETAAVTVRLTAAVLLACPLVPVTVTEYVPAGVEEVVEMLSVVEPEVVRL